MTQYDKQATQAIIRRCLAGDQTGYADLYNQFAPGVYRLCLSLVMNDQDAEDVMQDAFIYAFKNLHRYDSDRAAFKTWLYTITVSRCRNVYRRKQFPTLDFSQMLGLNVPAPDAERPEAALARRNARDAVQMALAALSPRLREAIVLRYGHGLTYREMAEVIGCPQKTAESRVRLAHQKLHGVLQSSGRALLEELLQV